ETAVHRQVLAPIVLDACIANCAPGLDALHAVGAAAQRWLQASRGEVAFGPPVGGQHGELAENQWQFAVTGMLEVEAYPARAFGDDFLHIGIIGAVVRRAFRQQGLESEDNVLGRYRLTVMKARLGTQMKANPLVVRAFL